MKKREKTLFFYNHIKLQVELLGSGTDDYLGKTTFWPISDPEKVCGDLEDY